MALAAIFGADPLIAMIVLVLDVVVPIWAIIDAGESSGGRFLRCGLSQDGLDRRHRDCLAHWPGGVPLGGYYLVFTETQGPSPHGTDRRTEERVRWGAGKGQRRPALSARRDVGGYSSGGDVSEGDARGGRRRVGVPATGRWLGVVERRFDH